MKPRRVDFSPDNLISGTAAQLTPEEFGVYWMICTLIYSKGGPIDDDVAWIAGIFKKTNPRTISAIIDRLIAKSKVERIGAELMVNRCRTELEAASNRIRKYRENGAKGGRPLKENKELYKPSGFYDNNLSAPSLPPSLPITPIAPKGARSSLLNGQKVLFENLWGTYPKKVGKAAAEKALAKASKTTSIELIVEKGIAYAKTMVGKDQQYTPNLSSWINQERWLDDVAPAKEKLFGGAMLG